MTWSWAKQWNRLWVGKYEIYFFKKPNGGTAKVNGSTTRVSSGTTPPKHDLSNCIRQWYRRCSRWQEVIPPISRKPGDLIFQLHFKSYLVSINTPPILAYDNKKKVENGKNSWGKKSCNLSWVIESLPPKGKSLLREEWGLIVKEIREGFFLSMWKRERVITRILDLCSLKEER